MIENQLPQIANLVAKGTLQVSVIDGKKLQGMAIKFKAEQQRINSDFVCVCVCVCVFLKLRPEKAKKLRC